MSRPDTHLTVLKSEAVSALLGADAGASGCYLDATFGRGGHSAAILEQLNANGRLIAFDRDAYAAQAASGFSDARFSFVHQAFSSIPEIITAPLDGALFDLGISSPQIDDGERGFSLRFDGPLDMRMDTRSGMTAADWLNSAELAHITEVLYEYGDERAAARIARAIVASRAHSPITTTGQLAALVANTIRQQGAQHPATRSFQAIRIFINRELEELKSILASAANWVKPGGVLAIISFHSLEDRLVKNALRPAPIATALRHLPVSVAAHPWQAIAKIMPSQAEVSSNPRARSAVLRVARRVAV